MSLEQSLDNLAAAIREQTAAFAASNGGAPAQPAYNPPAQPAYNPPQAPAQPAYNPPAPPAGNYAPPMPPAGIPTAPAGGYAPPPGAPAPAMPPANGPQISQAQVAAAAQNYAKVHGPKAAKAKFAELGVTKISEIQPANYGYALQSLQA